MRLSELLSGSVTLTHHQDTTITGLTLDSRAVLPGYVFIAIQGHAVDGRRYIPEAIAKGAVAILVEETIPSDFAVPVIPIKDLPAQVGCLAARFYGYPSRQLKVIGVTGTSGKTSCTQFLAQALDNLNIPCGIVGTLGVGFWNQLTETGLTTPDAITLQYGLSTLKNKGAAAVAMEVSSHSIHQARIAGIEFEVGVFTNLSQDHLDYHGNMAAYADAKRQFFTDFPVKQCVINADDPYAQAWLPKWFSHRDVITYSTQSEKATLFTRHSVFSWQGVAATVISPWGEGSLSLPLIGEFNLSNGLAVLASLCVLGIPFCQALQAMSAIQPVPGRMQTLGGGKKPLIVVDYAHKPDALLKVLQALRAHLRGKLICIFGCGGERDQGKRPMMASIAEEYADKVIVTNDNPRHEKPEIILSHILAGFKHNQDVIVELDRLRAIQIGIQLAEPGDCVLIAGKGAEHYQQIGETKHPFDDVQEAQFCLHEKI